MMKVTIEFNLPEEEIEARHCIDGGKAHGVLFAFDQWLRGEIKYHDKYYEELRDKLHELLSDANINIYD